MARGGEGKGIRNEGRKKRWDRDKRRLMVLGGWFDGGLDHSMYQMETTRLHCSIVKAWWKVLREHERLI